MEIQGKYNIVLLNLAAFTIQHANGDIHGVHTQPYDKIIASSFVSGNILRDKTTSVATL